MSNQNRVLQLFSIGMIFTACRKYTWCFKVCVEKFSNLLVMNVKNFPGTKYQFWSIITSQQRKWLPNTLGSFIIRGSVKTDDWRYGKSISPLKRPLWQNIKVWYLKLLIFFDTDLKTTFIVASRNTKQLKNSPLSCAITFFQRVC